MKNIKKVLMSLVIVAAMAVPAFAKKVVLKIEGVEHKNMKAVEDALKGVQGVKSVSLKVVDKKKKEAKAEIEAEDTVTPESLVEAAGKAGVKAEVQQ